MYSDQDISGVYGLINNTPESALRKMLVGGDVTEVHFRLLLKIAKNGPEGDFIAAFNAETLPKLRFSPAESKIKDTFWPACKKKFAAMGLLNLSAKAA